MKTEITYFEKSGEDNTSDVLAIALKRFQQGDIDAIVIASSFGRTAKMAADVFTGEKVPLLIVGEVLEGKQSPPPDVCQLLTKKGHQVIWGLPMGAMSKFSRNDTPALIADAYKRVSEGFKVVCEIILIATSSGYLQAGQKVLSIAGTHSGADTAVVARAAGYADFKAFQVHEILCKPYQRSAA